MAENVRVRRRLKSDTRASLSSWEMLGEDENVGRTSDEPAMKRLERAF